MKKVLFVKINFLSELRLFLLMLLLSLCFGVVQAQSLQEMQEDLNHTALTPEERLATLNHITSQLRNHASESVLDYAEEAVNLAKKLGKPMPLAEALTNIGYLQARYEDRPDKAAEAHAEAFRIYQHLYENDQISKTLFYHFLQDEAIPTYEYAAEADAKKKHQRRAMRQYQKLNLEFSQYLIALASDTKQQLESTQSELTERDTQIEHQALEINQKTSRLSQKEQELRRKRRKEKKLLYEKIQLSGNLQAKELETLALADSLTEQELEVKNQALKLLQEKAHSAQLAKEKAQEHLAVEQARIKNLSLLIGMGLLVVLGIIIGTSLWLQKRANRLLRSQKEEIHHQKEEIQTQRDNIEQQHLELQQQKEEIQTQRDNLIGLNQDLISERDKSDSLLLNILPEPVALELKEFGQATPQYYDMATVLFTDFKGFTKIAEELSPNRLVEELNYCFQRFDEIILKHDMEKIKTIGDAYMCVGGVPTANRTNAIDAVKTGLAMLEFMEEFREEKLRKGEHVWELRIGIHTGPLVAGVIGKNKFAYDVWGDTVNLASRMESGGEEGKVNISGNTYELVKSYFNCTYRGKVLAKNKGEIDMYFVQKRSSLFQGIQNLTTQRVSVAS